MMSNIHISGFADEICFDFKEQLETVKALGMEYISLRSANAKSIAQYTPEEVRTELLPLLNEFGIRVSSIGSPIGKVDIADDAGFEQQLIELENLCKICAILDCRYIRMFSFYMPKDENPEDYREAVIAKLQKFIDVAKKHDVVLLHENEKDIFGDIGSRCLAIFNQLASPHFRAAFDFANFVQCEEDPAICWQLLRPYIEYIHIKDAVSTDKENVLCGTGEGKIKELLTRAIRDEGYEGFLTLEPHLVLFASLASLETEGAEKIIKVNKAKDGAEGYSMQYHALMEILNNI